MTHINLGLVSGVLNLFTVGLEITATITGLLPALMLTNGVPFSFSTLQFGE